MKLKQTLIKLKSGSVSQQQLEAPTERITLTQDKSRPSKIVQTPNHAASRLKHDRPGSSNVVEAPRQDLEPGYRRSKHQQSLLFTQDQRRAETRQLH